MGLSDVVKPDPKFYDLFPGVKHVAVPISFDDEGLSSPSGAIPGVVLYSPFVGDILVDGWVEIIVPWDGVSAKADVGTFIGDVNGMWNWDGGAIDMTQADEVITQGGLLMSRINKSLSQAATDVDDRLVPAKFVTNDPLRFIVSSNGATSDDDPESTQGTAIFHLLIIPAL